MLKINQDVCKKCRICMKNCPIGAIEAGEDDGGKYVLHYRRVCGMQRMPAGVSFWGH